MAITFPSTEDINSRLDQIEARLPALPARLFKLQRTIAEANCQRTSAAFSALADSTKSVLGTARTSGKTVTGQARAATEDVVSSVRTGVNTVTGQASAQGKRVAKVAQAEATKLVDDAIDAVDDAVDAADDVLDAAIDAADQTPGSGTPYEQWTKADLVDRARERNIAGPTRMSKAELIDALRAS